MAKTIMTTCDRCGKKFDMWDEQEDFGLHYDVGYGSKFDGSSVSFDLCCQCFDEIVDEILAHKKEGMQA